MRLASFGACVSTLLILSGATAGLGHAQSLADGDDEARLAALADVPGEDPSAALPAFSFEDRPFAVAGVAGVGTIVGQLGLVVDVTPLAWLSAGGGLGSGSGGVQLGGYLRFRPLYWARARRALGVAISPALSSGGYESGTFDFGSHAGSLREVYVVDRAYWFQLDIAFELRARSGFMLVTGLGHAKLLNVDDVRCQLSYTGEATTCDSLTSGSDPRPGLATVTTLVGMSF